jgi:very-short-patch-repair endonuclease
MNGSERELRTKHLRDGCIYSEERNRKISEKLKGENNPTKRPEVRKRMSEAHKGHIHTEEHKRKISLTLLQMNLSQRYTPEVRAKMSKSMKGKKRSREHCLKLSARMKQQWLTRNRHLSEEHKRKIGLANKGNPKIALASRKRARELLSDPNSHIRKWLEKGWSICKWSKIRPTAPEKRVIDVISANQLPFRYSGNDIHTMIGGHIPDFIGIESRLIIEVLGIHWHLKPGMNRLDVEKRYSSDYKKVGYECACFWEDETFDKSNILNKIVEYMKVVERIHRKESS